MTTFDPRGFRDPLGWVESPDIGRRNPRAANRDVVQRWAVILSFCLCSAGLASPGLFTRILSPLLMPSGVASVEDLAESFAEGIVTGSEFRFNPGQINDLIAYLQTLQR